MCALLSPSLRYFSDGQHSLATQSASSFFKSTLKASVQISHRTTSSQRVGNKLFHVAPRKKQLQSPNLNRKKMASSTSPGGGGAANAGAVGRSALFSPLTTGLGALAHRVVLAPLTRNRADEPSMAPSALAAEYYEQRATPGGLLISEATLVACCMSMYSSTRVPCILFVGGTRVVV